jgi:hypothetical protein
MNDDITIKNTIHILCHELLYYQGYSSFSFSISSRIQGRRTTDFFFTLVFSSLSLSLYHLSSFAHRHFPLITQTERKRIVSATDERLNIYIQKKKMHHHQQYLDRRQSTLTNNSNKTTHNDFYTKLERIRLSSSSSKSSETKQKFFFLFLID